MQTRVRLLAVSFALALAVAALPLVPTVSAQQPNALERGYRTGYSDGYQLGWRDQLERAARDYARSEDYQRAERAYVAAYGAREDYRDGYQQGYEIGYAAGYERQGFDSTVPPGLARRGVQSSSSGVVSDTQDRRATDDTSDNRGVSDSTSRGTGNSSSNSGGPVGDFSGSVDVPQDTNLRVELLTRLSTDVTQRGDRFDARVIEPAQFAGATVSGRVARVRRPGKIKGAAELQLNIEQLRLPDGRFANLNAQVVEVVQRTGTGVGEVDTEGGVRGGNTTKDDVTKVGAGAGIGAVIGAIAGGGKGAAIGAVIGAGIGTAGVVTSRGGDIRLEPGTELVLRTSTNTRIQ